MPETPKRVIPVSFYKNESGREPVKEWLKSLEKQERKLIGEDIKMVQNGWPLGMPLVRKLEKGIWEVRTNLINKIARVLFVMCDSQIILLHGFIKKSQKTPRPDLELAIDRSKEVKRGGYEQK